MTDSTVVPMPRTEPPAGFTGQQLSLMRQTVAKDCNADEFDLFINMAQSYGLNPFRREIYAIVTNKTRPEKRQLVVVTGIDGLRRKASQSGDYCPDDQEPEIVTKDGLADPKTNPLGIEKAVVGAYKAGRRIIGVAYWDEFAPLKERWENNRPTGEFYLDPNKRNWHTMGRLMLAKCAEAQVLRKGWPETTSGLYEPSEMDQATIDLSPSEWADKEAEESRTQKVGTRGAVMIQWKVGAAIEAVSLGDIADRILGFLRDVGSSSEVEWWRATNQIGLRDFWAKSPGDALEVKKAIEATIADVEAAEAVEFETQDQGAA